MQVRGHLGDAHGAELRAARGVDTDAAGRGHPDVAFRVALHPVRKAGLARGLDPLGKEPPVRERAVGSHVVHPDEGPGGVVDVELALVGREAQPVGLVELALVDGEMQLAVRRHPEHPLPSKLARALDAVVRHPPEPRVGEPDGAVGAHADVVRAVELLALEVRGEDLAAAVRRKAHEARRRVLADDEVQVRVVGHAVALVRGAHDLAHPARLVPPPAHVAGHVGEQQVVLGGVPERPLGEDEARADLPDRCVGIDEGGELAAAYVVGHLGAPWPDTGTGVPAFRPILIPSAGAPQSPALGQDEIDPRTRMKRTGGRKDRNERPRTGRERSPAGGQRPWRSVPRGRIGVRRLCHRRDDGLDPGHEFRLHSGHEQRIPHLGKQCRIGDPIEQRPHPLRRPRSELRPDLSHQERALLLEPLLDGLARALAVAPPPLPPPGPRRTTPPSPV